MKTRYKRHLQLCLFEQIVLTAMVLILTLTVLDALEGNRVGKDDARLKAQQIDKQAFIVIQLK